MTSFSCQEDLINKMAIVEKEQPFQLHHGEKIYSRWAVVDAGNFGKCLVYNFLQQIPAENVIENVFKLRQDSGICFEQRTFEKSESAVPKTMIVCKNRIELEEWKSLFWQSPMSAIVDRYSTKESFERKVQGKSVVILSKTVFGKLDRKPMRLICSFFGLNDEWAKFTWVLGYSPHDRNTLRFLQNKASWVRPIVFSKSIHQLFKITTFLKKQCIFPKIKMCDSFVCSVCFDALVEKRLLTECRHFICHGCLLQCVSIGHFICPVCRGPLDSTFISEMVPYVEVDVKLENYEKALRTLVEENPHNKKWLVFQKSCNQSRALFSFLYKNDFIFYASTDVGISDVDMTMVDAVVVSQHYSLEQNALESYLKNCSTFYRSKPLEIYCLYFDTSFLNFVNDSVKNIF